MPRTTTTKQPEPPNVFQQVQQFIERDKCRKLDWKNPTTTGPVYFIRTFLTIYETRPEYGIGYKPFDLWPKQEEYILFLEQAYQKQTKQEIAVEKCRDMGASLLTLAWLFYHWLFDEHFQALMGTLTEDKIKLMAGHDTLFAKLRDYLENLPPWLLPKDFDFTKHLTSMTLLNPENGNTLRGELGTERFGRGPRAGVVFRDESAFWEDDTSENTVHTAQLNIDVSTVNGLNHFFKQVEAAAYFGNKFVFDRRDNPRMTDKWYAENLQRAALKGQLHIFKREIDRDYRASVEGQIYPNILKCARGDYDYNPGWPLYLIWDFGWSDMTYLGFIQRDPETGELYVIDEIYNNHVPVDWFVPFIPGKVATGTAYRYLPEHIEMITKHKQWSGKVFHFGDPTGNQTTGAEGGSYFKTLKKHGIRFQFTRPKDWQDMSLRQEKTSLLLLRTSVGNNCDYFYDSFTQFVVPKRPENSSATTGQKKGVHQWSHAVSALEAFAITEPPLEEQEASNKISFPHRNPWSIRKRSA